MGNLFKNATSTHLKSINLQLIDLIKEEIIMARKSEDIDVINNVIGIKIFELRIAMGMSRQELGEKIGVTHQQMQKYEKGTNRVSAGRLCLIAKVLDKPVEYFYEVVGDKNRPVKTQHQRMCIEVARNFMRIKKSHHQDVISSLVRSLADEN
jgi:transcriptional regulator with XRE-family HTH domain